MVIVLRASAFDDGFPFPKQKLKQAFVDICQPDYGIERIMSNSEWPDPDELECRPDQIKKLSRHRL